MSTKTMPNGWIGTYRYWKIYDEMPEGFRVRNDPSPLSKHVFIIDGDWPLKNGKLSIGRRALLRLKNEKLTKKLIIEREAVAE